MPKLIGNSPPVGAVLLDNNIDSVKGYVRVSWHQMDYALRVMGLEPERLRVSLDTTDKGSKGSLAKRWYRWFLPLDVAKKGTPAMQRRAAVK